MGLKIAESWRQVLENEFDKTYFSNLMDFVVQEYASEICYPPKEQIFAALNQVPFDKVNVVILGQDPYHGPGQANGLCFSVADGIKLPPSLVNIYKEIEQSTGATHSSGNLQRWANQGVLLLNATLTVRAHQAGSHQKKGWESFTDAIIQTISNKKDGVVFLLWGGYAKKKGAAIDSRKHLVLSSGHPSPLSANRGFWFGNNHFNLTNQYLEKQGATPIQW